jgi:hypothetical protein
VLLPAEQARVTDLGLRRPAAAPRAANAYIGQQHAGPGRYSPKSRSHKRHVEMQPLIDRASACLPCTPHSFKFQTFFHRRRPPTTPIGGAARVSKGQMELQGRMARTGRRGRVILRLSDGPCRTQRSHGVDADT